MKLAIMLISVLFIQGCALPKPTSMPVLGQPDLVNVLSDDMSVALKTLYLAGYSKGFSDAEPNPGGGSASIINTAGTIGYFSGALRPIVGPSFGLSGTTMGWLSLTQGLANKRTASDYLDRQLIAYIPKSLAKTEIDAERILAESVTNAVAQMDAIDYLEYENMTVHYDHAPTIDVRQVLIKTKYKLFYDDNEGFSQGTLKYKQPVRLFYMKPAKLKSVQQTPYSDQEAWLLSTKLYLTPYDELSKRSISLEYVDLANQLPEWCFIFKSIDNVPVVLNKQQAHLFVKPTHQKTAQKTPASNYGFNRSTQHTY
jgi:hypothetical protein